MRRIQSLRNRERRGSRATKQRAVACLVTSVVLALAATGIASGASILPASQSAQDLRIQKNIEYAVNGGEHLLLDAYIPASGGPFPGVVLVHGGGWVEGTKQWLAQQAQDVARAGYAAFSINYRLAPAFHYPAPVEDTADALAFVRDHADEFNVDPQRMALFGTSAGATLSLLVAEDNGLGSRNSQVAAVVSWSAGLDLPKILDQAPNTVPIQRWVPVYAGVPSGTPIDSSTAQNLLQEASPYYHLSAKAPPMFIANAKNEFIPFAQATEFVDKVQQIGIPYQFLTPATGHAVHYTAEAIDPTIHFLDQYVRDYQPGTKPSPSGTTVSPSRVPPTRTRVGPPAFSRNRSGNGSSAAVLVVVALLVLAIAAMAAVLWNSRRRSRI